MSTFTYWRLIWGALFSALWGVVCALDRAYIRWVLRVLGRLLEARNKAMMNYGEAEPPPGEPPEPPRPA